ncbi:MAG: response regulator transcription factor [Anaerolineae bacterium]
MPPIRVLLAEDHALVRAGFRALLEHVPDITVVGEAADGQQALQLVAEQRPDVVLMDIAMSGLNGLDATAAIVEQWPAVRVVILSMHANEEYVWRALAAGARGYLLKDAGTSELELAVRAVAAGDTYLSPPISKQVIAGYIGRTGIAAPARPDARNAEIPLTPRQRQVLQLLAEGHNVKEIARRLDISEKTVETHRAQIMERLQIFDLPGLVRYALRVGLVKE